MSSSVGKVFTLTGFRMEVEVEEVLLLYKMKSMVYLASPFDLYFHDVKRGSSPVTSLYIDLYTEGVVTSLLQPSLLVVR